MMIFEYTALDGNREEISGIIEASNRMEGLIKLKAKEDILSIHHFEEIRSRNKSKNYKLDKKRDRKKKERIDGEFIIPTMNDFKSFFRRNKDTDINKEYFNEFRNLFRYEENRKEEKEVLREEKEAFAKEGKAIDWSLIEVEETEEMKKNKKIRIKPAEIIIFTRRLSMMLASGISILKALNILKDTGNKKLNKVIEGIIDDINEGTRFSEAISKYPNQFDPTYVSLVAVGEDTGTLPETLKEIIGHMENQEDIRSKLKTASIYPMIIIVVLIIALLLASLLFIPEFEKMFIDQGMPTPLFTVFVFKIFDVVPFVVIGGIVIFILGSFIRTKSIKFDRLVRRYSDKLKLKLPLLKGINMATYMYTISSTVGIMISSGIRLKDTLELTSKTINNVYVQNDLSTVSDLMVEGYSFSEALREQEHIEDLLASMALTGEESGELIKALDESADYYNYELRKKIDNTMEMIQPLLILLVGLVAGPVIIAIYLPILSMSTMEMF